MRKAYLLSGVALAWAGLAEAQDGRSWTPLDCAEVETGSLEAQLLDCRGAGAPTTLPEAEVLDDLTPPEVEEAPEPVVVAKEPEVVPEPLPRAEAEPEPEPVMVIEEAPEEVVPEPLPAPEVVLVEEPDEYPSDTATEDWIEAHPIEDAVDAPEARPVEVRREDRAGEDARALRIPNGHRPPPGSCRVWFPDRPPGHQPPPTSCDVEVPAGAVMIRG